MRRVTAPLERMGARFEGGDHLPITVHGQRLGAIHHVNVPASAQVKSALLLAGLASGAAVTVDEPVPSRDHSEIMLGQFGDAARPAATSPSRADPSSAAFPLVAAAIVPGSTVTVRGLLVNPLRTGLYEVLEEMGADVSLANERVQSGEIVADMTLRHAPLAPCHVAADRIPAMIDEIPALAVACAFADGESVIEGLAELRVKESDRLGAIVAGLVACGVAAVADGDALRIFGRGTVRGGGKVVTHGDHRIAMAFLTLGLGAEQPVEVDEAEMIATSFPGFVDVMQGLGADIEGSDMSINSFGHLLRLTTWGESHGPAIGCVVDGCPPGIALDEAHIQRFLDLRRPGTGKNVSPRQEPDRVRILSGVYEGRTTGTPIALMIDNVDARSADYPSGRAASSGPCRLRL